MAKKPEKAVQKYNNLLGLVFANLGRADRSDQVTHSMLSLKNAMRPDSILGLVELGEGDFGYDDHALLRETFPESDYTIVVRHHMNEDVGHEALVIPNTLDFNYMKPILLCDGVPHWGPQRWLQPVYLPKSNTTVAVLHDPAGPHQKPGRRSVRVMAALSREYVKARLNHRQFVKEEHKKGRNVVWLADTNWRNSPVLTKGETKLFGFGPDTGRFRKAKGFKVHADKPVKVATYIEPQLHPGWSVLIRIVGKKK